MNRQLEEEFEGRDDIVFIHIQTVFEGFTFNTPAHGVDVARSLGIKSPIMHDARMDALESSDFMQTYRTRGTPWSIVIGRRGRIVFSGFTPALEELRKQVQRALNDESQRP